MKQFNISPLDSKQQTNIDLIKANLIDPIKLQLHSGMDGFESPDAYGIYRRDGGAPLGVVGKQFEPCDLRLFLDTIVQSIQGCAENLDLSKLTYNEFKGGSKVVFTIPLKTFEIESPMAGDTLKTALNFSTGFDGLTKFKLSYQTYRKWCSNGCGSWKDAVNLSFKNTISAQGKMIHFCNEIMKAVTSTENHVKWLNELATKKVTKEDIDQAIQAVTGYNLKEYKEMSTRKRNILDKINEAVAIEIQNTKATQFSVLQGITRYTTHELANGSEEALLFNNTVNRYNEKAMAHFAIAN